MAAADHSNESSDPDTDRRVLGIDPGLTRCGLGVVAGPPARPRLVATELVRTDGDAPTGERLLAVHEAVRAAIAEHQPAAVAVERVLFSKNVRTAMITGQAAGVVLLAAAQAGVTTASYSPTDVKLAVAGHGSADKQAVARMVVAQLRLAETPAPVDLTDALAVALCHLARARVAGAAAADAAAGRADGASRGVGAGSWEELVEARGVRVVGGTSEP